MLKVSGQIKGNVNSNLNVRGNIQSLGTTVVVDAKWGTITGNIEHQEDLMIELHERDTDGLSVQEIERILYVGF